MTTTDDSPFPVELGYLQFAVPGIPYSVVRVPLGGTLERDNLWVEHAMLIATLAQKVYREAFPDVSPSAGGYVVPNADYGAQRPEVHQRPSQPPQRPQGGQGQGETRADKYPLLEGWKCDRCGGPVGRRAATGNMKSDAAVCLGRCMDSRNGRNFVHSVGWLDD